MQKNIYLLLYYYYNILGVYICVISDINCFHPRLVLYIYYICAQDQTEQWTHRTRRNWAGH